MGEYRELDVLVNKFIVPEMYDWYFHSGPVMARLKANNLETYPGGDTFTVPFIYAPLKGGFYSPGASFDITNRQIVQSMTFHPKFVQVSISEFLENLEVLMKYPPAVFDRLSLDFQVAAQTMGAILEVAIFGEGVSNTEKISGFAEIANDGSNNSWTGSSYPAYGTLLRSDAKYGPALRGGMKAVPGAITYNILEEEYAKMKDGPDEPDLIVTTGLAYAYLKEKFQPQQRFLEQKEPTIGFRGLQFESATIVVSKYCPGSLGVNDPDIGNYLYSGYESMFMLTTQHLKLYLSDSELYNFGFSGFKPAQGNSQVAGQLHAALQFVCGKPCMQKQFTGINA